MHNVLGRGPRYPPQAALSEPVPAQQCLPHIARLPVALRPLLVNKMVLHSMSILIYWYDINDSSAAWLLIVRSSGQTL